MADSSQRRLPGWEESGQVEGGKVEAPPRCEMGSPRVLTATSAMLQELDDLVAEHRLSREEVGEVLRRVWYRVYQP